MWYIAGGSSVLSKSVPDGFPVVASSTLRPLTCIASGDSLLTWVSVKSQFFSEHAHSVQLVVLVLRPRVALFSHR